MTTRVWIVEFDEGDGRWKPFDHVAWRVKADAEQSKNTSRAKYPFNHWRFRVTRYVRG